MGSRAHRRLLKSGSHSAACEQYTAALAASVGGGGPVAPPTVVAVLHCNRAAAYQALGHLPEAIADCSRARALNANYVKVIDEGLDPCHVDPTYHVHPTSLSSPCAHAGNYLSMSLWVKPSSPSICQARHVWSVLLSSLETHTGYEALHMPFFDMISLTAARRTGCLGLEVHAGVSLVLL